MIGNKLKRFMDSRPFSAIMNLIGIALLAIAYGISGDGTPNIDVTAMIALIVGGAIFLLSVIVIILHKGIPLPKGMQLDERIISVLAGVAVLLIALLDKFVVSGFVFTGLDNTIWILWLSAGIIGLLAGLQSVFTRVL